VFSGGGEKPPEIIDTSGQDEDDDNMNFPGFSSYGGASGNLYGKDEDGDGGAPNNPSSENGYGRRGPYSESSGGGMTDDFIPGFGASENIGSSSVAGRQSGPLPSQEDMVRVTGNEPQWGRGGGGGRGGAGGGSRQSRWGPRGGGRY
jgi:polyadenylation factor subunit 2